ncbi:cytoskeleton-associated protein 5-like isoform X2 [Ptychodera flava]|uniref:cytoskeleton-associated protein 5-like isoform X2 n=1 Tax=Ptychodera flava TaxID=63121 RepID=UPI00396A82C0
MGDDTEYLKLPIDERCVHKVWKARLNGYEEAAKLFQKQTDDKSPEFSKYLGLLKKFVTDNNAVAQEKGLDAVLVFLDNAAHAPKTVGEVSSGVITKCLNSARTKTREKGMDILLMYVELEKGEVVQEELLKGLTNKQPKVVSACLQVLREALCEFGSKVIPAKPIVKSLPKMFENRDKNVREEAKLLTVEIYRWVGPAFKAAIQNIPPVVMKELEDEFEKVPSKAPKPTRFLKSQQDLKAKMEAEDAVDGEEEEEDDDAAAGAAASIDAYDLLDPVEILSKIPKDFYENIEAKKWQTRKEALEAIQPLVSNPKLEPGDYGDLVRALKKVVGKDTNVMLVAQAGKCLCGLATGLRKKFQPYAGQCIQTILEKFKEKKTNVVTSLREAIDAMYPSTNLQAILEDVLAALDSKNPNIRAETSLFLARCFRKITPATLPKGVLKPLCASLAKKMDDTLPDVRNAAAEALGTVLKVIGEKPLNAVFAEMDKLKVDKIKEASENVELEHGGGKKAKPAESKAAAAKPAPKKETTSSRARSSRPATAGPGGRANGPQRPSTAPPGGKKKAKSKANDDKEDMATEPLFTDEEVDDKAEVLLPQSVRQQLQSSNWKERLAAIEEFTTLVNGKEKKDIQAQVFVRVMAKKPGWKENNFQVLNRKFQLVKIIAEKAKFTRRSGSFVITGCVDKIGDGKVGNSACEVLTAVAEATNLGWVSSEVVRYAFDEQKNPKNQSESLNWFGNAIKEFGFSSITPKNYISYIKKAFGAVNPAVRASATSLVGVMYMYMGAPIRTLFEDEKAALLQQIDAEIVKVEGDKPPKPIRGQSKRKGGGDSDNEKDEDEEDEEDAPGGAAAMEDLVPRVDIGQQITSQIIEEMGDTKWKIRGEALQKVQGIISDAKFITPNLGDLPPALKARLGDNNKLLATTTVNICQQIATSMGSNVKRYTNMFAPGMLSLCSDNKPSVRAAAVACLKSWVEQTGLPVFFEDELMCTALAKENPLQRIELYGWLEEEMPKCKSIPSDGLIPCIPTLYSALEDRNAEVRKKAQAAVPMFMMHLSYEKMFKMTGKLKPSSKDQIVGILEKQRANVPAKPGKAKKAAAAGSGSEDKRKEPETAVSSEPEPKRPKTAPSKLRAARSVPCIPDELNPEKNKAERANALIDGPIKGGQVARKGKPGLAKGKASSKKGADEDTGPALVANNGKQKRFKDESDLKVLKWNFPAPRDEHIDQLKDQMQGTFSKAIITSLFHSDFKNHINALNTLIECVDNNKEAVISNSDLLLKYVSIRFFDTNTTVILKCLEFLSILFTMLAEEKFNLSELEANAFIPYFVTKFGDAKEAVRREVRGIIKMITKVYPASKMFTFVMNGVQSKNSRQRQECLEELGCLIEIYGMSVCQPTQSKALKEIASNIGDRDNSVRSAALNTLVQAYAIVGNDLYKLVGHLNDKDLGYLEERIKRSAKKPPAGKADKPQKEEKPSKQEQKKGPMPPGWRDQFRNPSAGPKPTQKHASSAPKEFSLDLDKIGLDQTVADDMPELVDNEVDDLLNQPVTIPEPKMRPASPSLSRLASSSSASSALDLVISQIASNDIHISVQALAQIDEVLKDEEKSEALSNHIDQLLVVTALQLRMAFTKYMGEDEQSQENVIKLYRCLVACLMSLFQNATLAKRASREVLKDLLHGLITVLLDDRLVEFNDGPQVVRSVNVLVVKVVEKSDHNNILGGLIKLLQDCVASEAVTPKFTELVMKCLWKMVRMLPNIVTNLNIDRVLLDLHIFLKSFPSPSQTWKERGSDTPLRTIKTIMHSLAKILGNKILSHFSLIEDPNESELQMYLQKVLRTGTGRRSSTSKPTNTGQINGNANDAQEKNTAPVAATQSPRRSAKTHDVLAEIFKKISSKENTREGLAELYEFKKKNPETDLDPYLKRSSQFFHSYIERGLKNIEKEREGKVSAPAHSAGGDTSSTPAITMSLPGNEDDLPPAVYRDRLKILRARCGLDNNSDSKVAASSSTLPRPDTAPPPTLDSKATTPRPRYSYQKAKPRQYSFQKISLGTSSTLVPSAASMTSQSSDTNVDELKKRLERIKKQSKS